MTFPDYNDIFERHVRQLHKLPWVLPAVVVMQMDEIDFDMLSTAPNNDERWRRLNGIVRRITACNSKERGVKVHSPGRMSYALLSGITWHRRIIPIEGRLHPLDAPGAGPRGPLGERCVS